MAATTYWFASKDDLLIKAYRRAADRDIARVRRVIADHRQGDSVADALTAILGAELEDGRTALVACFTMWLEAARRPELRAIEAEWTEAYESVIEDLLRAAGAQRPSTRSSSPPRSTACSSASSRGAARPPMCATSCGPRSSASWRR